MKNHILKILMLVIAVLISACSTYKQSESHIQNTGPGHYKIKKTANNSIEIPFKFLRGKPLLDLKINGKQAKLMIDNGILWDQVWLFGSPLVEELDLKPINEGEIGGAGAGDPTAAYTSSDLKIEFKDITFFEQPVLVSPAAAGFASMFPGVDGQLCNTFFKHFIVEFDFIENIVILHDPNSFKFNREGCVLPLIENESGTHKVPFSYVLEDGREFEDWVDIDFGGIYPIKVALNNKNKIDVPEGATPVLAYGASGEMYEYAAPITKMKIGDYVFENVMAVFGDEKTARIHPDNLGVIGLPLFMRFNTIFDYINNKLYLEPNSRFSLPFNVLD